MEPQANYEYQNIYAEQHPGRGIVSNNSNMGSNSNHTNNNNSLPATPRMLRNVSGSQKGSASEIVQQQPQPSPQNLNLDNNDGTQYQTPTTHPGGATSRNLGPAMQSIPAQQVRHKSSANSMSRSSTHRQASQEASRHSSQNSAKNSELLPPAVLQGHPSRDSPAEPTNAAPTSSKSHRHAHQSKDAHSLGQQQQFHRKSIGDWDFVKTIGAGSMGKVKLAQHNSSGEICAVKIVPRAAKLYQRSHANDPPPLNAQAAAQRQKEMDKEIARDKRTIREGALGRLLFHPFICRLYEMVPMTNHYYMLFEYVEGGQMLDYIVSHGSLKERNARKFARGIASALDYCHKNNVVHRDLKIENIMINQKGDIKIIDFGLSNLYSPKSLLKTYCGSLYFAAPELLSAKPYLGPEVDVWSFGVVLYVLVCGKVPFDDQSVSVLHEKIKRGNVEYPSFLSKECVSLLSRMLVVDPKKRAKLYEIVQHPWMSKGYDTPLSSFMPKRLPLKLPLNPEIIKTIAAFDLGSVQAVADELNTVVNSVEYQMSSENWYKITEQGKDYASAPNSSILPDPTCGFHPLISIYYLVDEMRKRKRAKEDAMRMQMKERAAKENQDLLKSQENSPQVPVVNNRDHDTKPKVPPIQVSQASAPLSFPPQAHTSSTNTKYNKEGNTSPIEVIEPSIPVQQPHSAKETSPVHDTLDPMAGKSSGINSLLRKLSGKKYRPTSNNASPSSSQNSMVPPPLPKFTVTTDQNEKLSPQTSNTKKDPMVRRGVSMKVTAKEKSSSSRIDLTNSANMTKAAPNTEDKDQAKKIDRASHQHSSSNPPNQTKFQGFVPVEYLPPLPNINTATNTLITPSMNANAPTQLPGRKLHPTARAKSVGGHIRKDSYGRYRPQNETGQPLPDNMANQNSDELIASHGENDGFFDDVTLGDVDYQEVPQLTEEQIIEQFNNAKPNSLPSIEYPKTLFLKGFFSVQTTSTKPLPVIRYNIINVLSKLGVKFREVRGGFICVHTPSLQEPVQKGIEDDTSNNQTIETQLDDQNSETVEEKKLYGDAFKSRSSSLEGPEVPPKESTPETEYNENFKTPSRQPSTKFNAQTLSPISNSSGKSHKSSNSYGGHRRKFSLGNSILGSYRKKNGSQTNMPPNTPATAKVGKLLYPDDDVDDEINNTDIDKHLHLPDDDSVDSLNGLMIGGGSDMLISSRVEHRAKHQHTSSQSGQSATKKSPLKFEIHIVKVPLVGLYGVQFKKLLGNTWNYKTLASQILNELNL